MKFILLILSLLFSIHNSYAESEFSRGFLNSQEIGAKPAWFMIISPLFFYSVYKYKLDDLEKKSKIDYRIKYKKINCPNLFNFTIDAKNNNLYIGDEFKSYSNIQKVQLLDFKINFSDEKYLCLNPKKNFIFKNGCLDYLKPNSIKQATGIWQLNLLFKYDGISYAQFKNTKTQQTASTELFNLKQLGFNLKDNKCL